MVMVTVIPFDGELMEVLIVTVGVPQYVLAT